jgi:hypothetical protein
MPLNRFITFVKPYINLLAGAFAAWLIAKANVLGISGLGENGNELETGIAAAMTWALTQGATQLGDLRWIKGHQIDMIDQARVRAALLEANPPAAGVIPAQHEPQDADLEDGEAYPPDEGEDVYAAVVPFVVADPSYEEEPADDSYLADEDDLVADDEEFGAPPPDETNMPVQPSQAQREKVAA